MILQARAAMVFDRFDYRILWNSDVRKLSYALLLLERLTRNYPNPEFDPLGVEKIQKYWLLEQSSRSSRQHAIKKRDRLVKKVFKRKRMPRNWMITNY
jgi:hypothetical protein